MCSISGSVFFPLPSQTGHGTSNTSSTAAPFPDVTARARKATEGRPAVVPGAPVGVPESAGNPGVDIGVKV
ncbi:hypothetical protein GCM10022247_18330 [Allokutzneria multivorans]|uniref:Uncharacterized protein n=1 Tax=Allokutzneria multivorans TaxID=1142134 RepID=A0ABP7RJI3_9PSEU